MNTAVFCSRSVVSFGDTIFVERVETFLVLSHVDNKSIRFAPFYIYCLLLDMPKVATDLMSKVDSTNVAFLLTGALLPTAVAWMLWPRKRNRNRGGSAEDSDDDDDDDSQDGLPAPTGAGSAAKWDMSHAPYKMVFCVNQELSMGKGKIAAQCCHAAVGCYKRALKQCPGGVAAWERTGCAKIALKCPTEADLEDIAVRALAKEIPCYLVEDAGRTQIAAGSRTVLGLGPAPVSVFEGVSDHLKLM